MKGALGGDVIQGGQGVEEGDTRDWIKEEEEKKGTGWMSNRNVKEQPKEQRKGASGRGKKKLGINCNSRTITEGSKAKAKAGTKPKQAGFDKFFQMGIRGYTMESGESNQGKSYGQWTNTSD